MYRISPLRFIYFYSSWNLKVLWKFGNISHQLNPIPWIMMIRIVPEQLPEVHESTVLVGILDRLQNSVNRFFLIGARKQYRT